MIACAQRIARAGPSNVAKKPSPAVSTSRPSNRSELAPHGGVVLLDEVAPAPVPELRRLRGRADEIGEEHGGEHAIAACLPRATRQELPNLGDRLVWVEPRDVIVRRSSTYVAPANRPSEKARVLHVTHLSPAAWTMSVGTLIAGTTWRTSMSNAMRMNASA